MERTKTPTIVDIAAAAGVSRSAVSRALLGQGEVSEDKRKRIEEAAKRLGYVANAMARGLASSRTRTIGVVLRDVKKPYYAFLQAGMQSQAERRDYRIVATTNAGELEVEDALREIRNLISLQVDGLVIAPARLPSADFVPFLKRVPIVVAGRHETSRGISSVGVDDVDGGYALAQHLIELGHRRIAVVLVSKEYSLRYGTRGRAMVDAIHSAGGTAVVWEAPTDLQTGQIVDANLDGANVTAIMCPTDPAAMDTLEVLRQRGLLDPQKCAVTGYDGYGPLAAPFLGLTTFRQPIEEVGRAAIDLLIDRLEGRSEEDRFVSLRGTVVPGRTAAALSNSDSE